MPTYWITTKEASKLSGYHPVHLRRLLLSGRIDGRKFGEVWQISRPSLLAHVRKMGKAGEKRGPKNQA